MPRALSLLNSSTPDDFRSFWLLVNIGDSWKSFSLNFCNFVVFYEKIMILWFPKKLLRSWNRSYVHTISRIRQQNLVSCASDEKKTESWGKKFWKSAKIPHKNCSWRRKKTYKKSRKNFSSSIKNLIYLVASWLTFSLQQEQHHTNNRQTASQRFVRSAKLQTLRGAHCLENEKTSYIFLIIWSGKNPKYIFIIHTIKTASESKTGQK